MIQHHPFLQMFKQFGRSHFMLGFELLCALCVMALVDRTGAYGLTTMWCWMFAATCLWAPFIYNFEGLEYNKIRDDFIQWWEWMSGGWYNQSHGWQQWHNDQAQVYDGANILLVVRGSFLLLIPLATGFK